MGLIVEGIEARFLQSRRDAERKKIIRKKFFRVLIVIVLLGIVGMVFGLIFLFGIGLRLRGI